MRGMDKSASHKSPFHTPLNIHEGHLNRGHYYIQNKQQQNRFKIGKIYLN